MARKSRAEIEAELAPVPAPNVTRLALVPPACLPEAEANEFRALVSAVGARHFIKSDVPLLAAYVQAIVGHRAAAAALAREGAVTAGRPSAWSAVLERYTKSLATLSRALRLSPASRSNSRQAERNATPGRFVMPEIDWGAPDADE